MGTRAAKEGLAAGVSPPAHGILFTTGIRSRNSHHETESSKPLPEVHSPSPAWLMCSKLSGWSAAGRGGLAEGPRSETTGSSAGSPSSCSGQEGKGAARWVWCLPARTAQAGWRHCLHALLGATGRVPSMRSARPCRPALPPGTAALPALGRGAAARTGCRAALAQVAPGVLCPPFPGGPRRAACAATSSPAPQRLACCRPAGRRAGRQAGGQAG